MNGSEPKKDCKDYSLLIGTHDGTFHCDEVLACWMLKQLPKYKDAEILRSRNPAQLEKCDIVVDVGGVYDPDKNRFDHHQRTFDGTMKSLANLKWVTKLSSAGLVYLHFGKELIGELCKLSVDDAEVSQLYSKIYDKLIEEVDAVDNGIEQYDGTPRYHITTTLASRVSSLNPAWNVENADVRSAFDKAMEMCGEVFVDRVNYYKHSWIPARKIVEEAIENRAEVDSSGEIIAFKTLGCPWKEHLFDIEEEQNISPSIKFVIYIDKSNMSWRVQCVPESLGSFQSRVPLNKKWCGLRDESLSEISDIPNCIFVHASGFIGGNKTYEGALEMAKKTLALNVLTN